MSKHKLSTSKANLLYLHSSRAKESHLLQRLEGCIDTIMINSKDQPMPNINNVKHIFYSNLLFLENPGIYNILYVLVAKIFQKKVITRLKGDPWSEYRDKKYIRNIKEKIKKTLNFYSCKIILHLSDSLIPISTAIADLPEVSALNKKTYILGIPYSLLPELLAKDVENNDQYLLTVTNFNFYLKVKCLDDLIPLISKTLDKNNLRWVILGGGTFLEKIKSKYENIQNISFEYSDNPNSFYKHAQLVLYFSCLDGLPNVLLETAMHKKAIVINSMSPLVEFIEDKKTGYILDESDYSSAEEKLNGILSDIEGTRQVGENLNVSIKKKFSIEALSKKLEEILRAENII